MRLIYPINQSDAYTEPVTVVCGKNASSLTLRVLWFPPSGQFTNRRVRQYQFKLIELSSGNKVRYFRPLLVVTLDQ